MDPDVPIPAVGHDLRDGLPSELGPVALGAQVAEHQGQRRGPALRENLPQQTPALFVAQMKMGAGIGVDPQKLRVVVGLHIDKIGIGKPAGKPSPIPKVGGDHHFLPFAVPVGIYGKPKGGANPVVRQTKRLDGEIADPEGTVGKGADFEVQKREPPEMPAGQRLDVLFVKVNRNPAFFQEAEGGILDVVAVQMRNDRAVDCGEKSVQGFSTGTHGGKPGIDKEGGLIRSQKEGISRTAAAEGLKS